MPEVVFNRTELNFSCEFPIICYLSGWALGLVGLFFNIGWSKAFTLEGDWLHFTFILSSLIIFVVGLFFAKYTFALLLTGKVHNSSTFGGGGGGGGKPPDEPWPSIYIVLFITAASFCLTYALLILFPCDNNLPNLTTVWSAVYGFLVGSYGLIKVG